MTAAAVAARERPIPFTGRLIAPILRGEKTVTRRLVRPQPFWLDMGTGQPVKPSGPKNVDGYLPRCPFGVPGDRLWVREAHQYLEAVKGGSLIRYLADGAEARVDVPTVTFRRRPPMFMHHAASRITLDVESVRVERLQDITEEDAIAEGAEACAGNDAWTVLTKDGRSYTRLNVEPDASDPEIAAVVKTEPFNRRTAREVFARGWDSLNGKRPGASWADNPWVWRIEFKRVEAAVRAQVRP